MVVAVEPPAPTSPVVVAVDSFGSGFGRRFDQSAVGQYRRRVSSAEAHPLEGGNRRDLFRLKGWPQKTACCR